jgi:hypothetical protein
MVNQMVEQERQSRAMESTCTRRRKARRTLLRWSKREDKSSKLCGVAACWRWELVRQGR